MKRLFLLLLLTAAVLAGCGRVASADLPSETVNATEKTAVTKETAKPTEESTATEETTKTTEEPTMTNEETPDFRTILDRLGYDYTILDADTLNGDLIAFFDAALEEGKAAGYTPVLVVGDGRVLEEALSYRLDDGFDVEAERQKELPDGEAVLEARHRELEETMGTSMDTLFTDGCFDGLEALMESDLEMFGGIQSALMFGGEVALVRLPTANPWEAAIMLPFGGFNECPEPSDMAAVLKYWYEKYGAVPAVITYDMLDLRLPAPISRDEARAVAVEQVSFDADIALSGLPLSLLEASLSESRVWSFWWD